MSSDPQHPNADASAVVCRFREARAADASFLDRCLPRDRGRGVSFVGEVGGRAIAAFAVAPTVEHFDPAGLGVAMCLSDNCPTAAVTGRIVDLASQMAGTAGLRALYTWPHPVEESAIARLWTDAGFETFDRLIEWEVLSADAFAVLAGLLGRLSEHRPTHRIWQAEDRPLPEVDPDEVVRLYEAELAQLGERRVNLRKRLTAEGDFSFHPQMSRVLVADGRLIGFVLVNVQGRVCRVLARVVARPFQDGLANLRLMYGGLAADPERTGRIVRFESQDKHAGTGSLAKRLGGKPVKVRLKMRKLLA